MRGSQFLFIVLIIFPLVNQIQGGFFFGGPCSERNTLHITQESTSLPTDPVRCVDISKSGSIDLQSYKWMVKNATTLYAQRMQLARIPHNFTRYMPRLELIDLSGNNIRQFHPKIFSRHQQLETLLLNENNVYIPRKRAILDSSSLRNLHLSNNNIKRLTRFTFMDLPSLVALFLDGNYLRGIEDGVFEPLVNLKYLHLGRNKIKYLPERSMLPVSLDIFVTKGNPLNCTVTRFDPFHCK